MKNIGNNPETQYIVRGLLQTERQRVVASFIPDAAPSADVDAEDRAWREHNTEAHPYREIMVILEEDIQFQLASRVYAGRVGDIVLFDAFETHDRFHPPSVRDAFTLWMQISPQSIVCSVIRSRNSENKVIMRFDFSQTELCAFLNRVWYDAETGRKAPKAAGMEIGGVVNVVRGEFAEKLMNAEVRYNRDFSEARNRPYLAVVAAMNHIGAHIGERQYFDDLAERAGYSRQHFARLFREYSGYNFRDYVDHVRMGMFRKMYFVKNMPKKDIARALGFSSSSALIHWLRGAQNKHPEQNVTARRRRHGDKGTI